MSAISKSQLKYGHVLSTAVSLLRILGCLVQLAVEAVQAFAHPEDEQRWRSAWVYFWMPATYFGLFGVLASGLLFWILPSPWDWIFTPIWVLYIWIGEPMMFYVEGNGFEKAEHYIKTGQWLPWDWKER